jgi:hypothetical protein
MHSLEGFAVPLKVQPGDGWVYGVGIDYAGHIVQTIFGLSFEDYMGKHILKHLVCRLQPSVRPSDQILYSAMHLLGIEQHLAHPSAQVQLPFLTLRPCREEALGYI